MNITFFVFIPTKICDLIETRLNNTFDEVKPDTPLAEAHSSDAMYYKVKTAFEKIGFNGFSKYGDRIMERITHRFNDEDLKEFLMGHKGKISSVYQIAELTGRR